MTSTERDLTPVEVQIGGLLEALKASQERPDPRFTVASLIAALGVHSHIVVILVFSVLNMVPGPPGYGGTIAIAIIGFSIAMMLNAPLTLPGWVRRRKLPARALMRVAELFARMAAAMGRFSRPRFTFVSARALQPVLALFIIAVSLPMMLPIPLINAIPNTGICILCLGWINRDAFVIIAGIIVALLGLSVAAAAIWGVWHLANAAVGAVQ
ncbi:exopolysaccharide biosynthesis protein [Pelagibacterium sp.]|uniref:exopolysaccharide biosynthesis protein n=1 Tax=Pelagibacterium sp. TaxID=1967288 RepID=UPI003A8EF526